MLVLFLIMLTVIAFYYGFQYHEYLWYKKSFQEGKVYTFKTYLKEQDERNFDTYF